MKMPLHIFSVAFAIFIFSCNTDTKDEGKAADKHSSKTNDTIQPQPAPAPPLSCDLSHALKQDTLLAYIKTASKVTPVHNMGPVFAKLDFNKLIGYDFEGSEEPYPGIIDNGTFVPVVLAQQYLTQEQAERLLSALSRKENYGGGTAHCFHPHFALLFFKDDKRVEVINICLGCNYLLSGMLPSAMTQKGFSKKGKQAIKDICKELNFYYGRPGNDH